MLAVALLVVSSVLSSTLLIPGVRPFMAWLGNTDGAHSFMALALLGGVFGAPVVARVARRLPDVSRMAALLAALDSLLLAALLARPSLAWLLAARTAQGALNLAVLTLLLGAAPIRQERRGSSAGLLGAAVMLGVALGSPLGTLCLRLGPTGPVAVGALLEAGVALALIFVRLTPSVRDSAAPRALPWLPMAWVFAERFAIGLFVVTFALHARGCLGSSDAEIGGCFSAFMITFVLFVYPAGALSDRWGSSLVAALGLLVYGLGWLLLASATLRLAGLLMPLLGVSSALVYASALRRATRSAGSRIAAMSGLNAAGALGMLCGTAIAGIASATLRNAGAPPHAAHDLVLQLAGWFQLAAGLATAGTVLFVVRHARLMRS